MTGKDLGLKPSTVQQAKFEYSLLGNIFTKRLKEKDKKEWLLKKLKNIEINQNSNNNNDDDKSNLSSARSELNTKTLINNDETQTSCKYLKDTTEEFFGGFPNIFDSSLKEFFDYIASEEKENIDYNSVSKEILTPSRNTINFLQEYGYLYNFWFHLLFDRINLDDLKSQQIKFLKDLINGFEV